jgi:uncharacterized protein YbjT (DUF2867 family)
MKLFLTGATGFTGSRVVPLLLERGHSLRCLHRPTSKRTGLDDPLIEWEAGDLAQPEALVESMRGCDVLVNLASLGFGHAPGLVAAAQSAGISRAVFISTTAIFTQLNARSKSVRREAEETIQSSRLDYTILRPTMIYGSSRDRNIWRLIRWLKTWPIIPILGSGDYLQQPIYVDDVALAVAGCLPESRTSRHAYNIAGKHALTYNQIIDTITAQLGRRVWKLHLPAEPAVAVLRGLERVRLPLPVKSEQVLRLNENKDFSYQDAQTDFGFAPRDFSEGIRLELIEMHR